MKKNFTLKITFITAFLLFSIIGYAANINVTGTVAANTTWNYDTVKVTGDITVQNGVTLTISSGTYVEFQGHHNITVYGAIQAEGVAGDTIVFTASNTTTGWDGIQVDYSSNSVNDSCIFNYCKFEYAKRHPNSYSLCGAALSISERRNIRVTNSRFINNVMDPTTTWGYGSAIDIFGVYTYAFNATDMKFNNNTFSHNSGKYATVSVRYSNCEFSGNTLYNNTNSSYGALYIHNSGGHFMNNTISNNTGGNYGGGLHVFSEKSGTEIKIYNSLIVNNTAQRGGGIYFSDSKAQLYNNTIANNTCSGTLDGGGIYFHGNSDAILKSNIIYGNKSAGTVSNQIHINDISADPKFYNCDIEGGMPAFIGIGTGINYSGAFSGNINSDPDFKTPTTGAGIAFNGRAADWSIDQGSPVINSGFNSSIEPDLPSVDLDNKQRIFNGRIDIGAYENQDPIISPCTISSNTLWQADTIWVGCDLVIDTNAVLTILPGTHIIFSGYYNINVKGSILALGSPDENIVFTVFDTTGFSANSATNGAWNGIDFYSVALGMDSSKFEYCKFTYAKAISASYQYKSGGAMNIYNSPKVAIENCMFSNNMAQNYGSALYVESSNIKFNNNIVCNNTSIQRDAAIYMNDVISDFCNNTVVNNLGWYNGGIYVYSSTLNVKNCLFWGNERAYNSNTYGSQAEFYNSSTSKVYNSNIQFGIYKVGSGPNLSVYQDNQDIDPLFINPSSGPGIAYDGQSANWALNSNTPLVDKGFFNSPMTTYDFNGRPRLVSDTIDIGAFEVQLSPKFIIQHPVSKSVCEGTSTGFSINTSISVNYQWVHNGTHISGANGATYVDTNSTIADTGYYYCILSTSDGSINSDTAIFDIQFAPSLTTSPISTTTCFGDTASFAIAASGTEPMVFTWENSLGPLPTPPTVGGATIGTQSYSNSSNGYPSTFANYFFGNKYQFIIRASELTAAGVSAGNINSIAFNVLNVNLCPALSNYSVSVGNSTATSLNSNFKTGLTNVYSAVSYQAVPGWNTINFQNPYVWDGTSNLVFQICSSNTNNVNNGNASIAFSYTAYNSSVYRYANSSNICSYTTGYLYNKRPVVQIKSGTVNNLRYYNIDSVLASHASIYKCNISNMCGSVLSNGAQLTVNTAPNVVPIIAASSICENQSYTYSTSATGTAPVNYQWYKDGSPINGSNSISHSISSAAAANDGIYYCKATNTCGDDSTNQSVLNVNLVPNITSQPPASQTLCENQSASLSIAATGDYPITFQWYKAGAPIGGATSSSYLISPIIATDAGLYKCIATNSCGNDQSNDVTIAVNSPPSITYQSGDSARCETGGMTFDLTATGTAPLTYQWYKGSTLINGANSGNYSLNNLSTSDGGTYRCLITNSCASISSVNKNLTVNANPQVSLGNDTSFCLGGSTTIGPGYGYFCLWNNGSYNNQLTVTNTGSYFVDVTDQNGCEATSNTINISVIEPYVSQELCVVTIDSATGKNVIVWEKTPNQGISSFNIYRESSVSGVYTIIANQDYDSLSLIVDLTSNPANSPDRYAITVVDSCGNESPFSTEHRSMHLTVNQGQNNDWNLIWNAYEGFTPSSYKIYRADTSLNFVDIATVAGSSSFTYLYTDNTAPTNVALYYYVEVIHPNGGCSATKAKTNYNSSRSNHANNGMTSPVGLVPAFFATPTSGIVPMQVHFFDQSLGDPEQWKWNFGDGSTDTAQFPTHTYTQVGVYNVSLWLRNADGIDSTVFFGYIDVLPTGVEDIHQDFDVKVFPNPYSNQTTIAYALNKQSKVHLEIYTAQGKKVARLVDNNQGAGSYRMTFNARDYGFSSGVYYLRMTVDGQVYTKKLIQVK